MVHNSLVYRSSSSTEAVIQRTIEGTQRLIKIHNSPQGEGDEEEGEQEPVIQINPAMKKHWESEIKILRDAPPDAEKLREILKVKQKEYDKAKDREDIERLVPEVEMLKFVLFLVCRNESKNE
jgi:PleD family two-component response regulator